MSRPRNTSWLGWPNTCVPSSADMPYCVTMARAIFVARSRSLLAPVVTSSQKISSATRPPMNTASSSRISPTVLRTLSSLGMDRV